MLTINDRKQIAQILARRAQEIASFKDEYTRQAAHHGSVELALTREIERLRRLAHRVDPPEPEENDA